MNLNQAKSPSANQPLPAAGMQAAFIVQIVGLGLHPSKPYQGQPKPDAKRVRVTYELVNERHDFNGELKPLVMSEEFPFSSSDKSRCYKRFNGIDPNLTQSKGDLAYFIGKPVFVQVTHRQGTGEYSGRTFAEINLVTPLPSGFPMPEAPYNATYLYDPYKHNQDIYDKLPDFLKEKIQSRKDNPANAAQRTAEPTAQSFEPAGAAQPSAGTPTPTTGNDDW